MPAAIALDPLEGQVASFRLDPSAQPAGQPFRHTLDERAWMTQSSHQLKAPVAALHAQCQLLLGAYCGTLPPGARDIVEKMSARCLGLSRQIQEMLQLAQLRSSARGFPERKVFNLGAVMEDILDRLEPAARQRGVRFEMEFSPITIDAVQDHVILLLDNLLVNALNYSYDHGLVTITGRQQPAGGALLSVRDEGIGIPKEKLPRIFDDYYRTDEAVQHHRASTGLGLAIVRQIASQDGFPVTVESAPGWGTRFTVLLPSTFPDSPLTPVSLAN